MVDRARRLLDSLMGEDRNDITYVNKKNIDEICKFALCGGCPFELLKNTKFKIGKCKYKYHYTKNVDVASEKIELYEMDLLKLLVEIFSKVKKNLNLENEPHSTKIESIRTEIKSLIKKTKELATKADLFKSIEVVEKIEVCYKKLEKEKESLYTSNKELKIPKCSDCGSSIIKSFGSSKYESHINAPSMKKNFRERRNNNRRDFKNDDRGRRINKKKGTVKSKLNNNVLVSQHTKFENVYVCRGKSDLLLTKNLNPGSSVYGEKRISVTLDNEKTEYRVWNVYRSKLAAGIICGLDNIYIKPGSKVLYLGASSGTTVSHVSDIVGPSGVVYAVEFSQRSGRDLINLAMKRTNIIPIIEDARHPYKYRMLVESVDTIFSDVSQPDQTRIVALNAQYFLKDNGGVLVSIKANCVNSALPAEKVFADEVNILKKNEIKPKEQVPLEPYEKDHAIILGIYRQSKKSQK